MKNVWGHPAWIICIFQWLRWIIFRNINNWIYWLYIQTTCWDRRLFPGQRLQSSGILQPLQQFGISVISWKILRNVSISFCDWADTDIFSLHMWWKVILLLNYKNVKPIMIRFEYLFRTSIVCVFPDEVWPYAKIVPL